MKDVISIIIPMYNAEKYIVKLLECLKNQTYQNLEILIINDGSTDNSLNICNQYAKKNKNINIISIENGGVGNARNIGIQRATGEYITFLDADDYIELDMYEKIIKKVKETNAKLLRCNFVKEDPNGNLIDSNNNLEEFSDKFLETDEIKEKLLYKIFDDKVPTYTCLIFAKTDLIKNKHKFRTDIKMMEDLIFCLELYTSVKNIYMYDFKCYHYVRYSESSTKLRKNLIRNYKDTLKVIKLLEEFLIKRNISKELLSKIYTTYSMIMIKYIIRLLQKDDEYSISISDMIRLLNEGDAINIIKKSDNIENVYINNMANLLKKEKVKEAYDYGIKIRNIDIFL